jgi:hypothetical protein
MRYIIYLTIFLVPISLFCESNFSTALSSGAVEGKVQLFYYNINKKTDDDAYATALGGHLKYSTDANRTFYAAVRFDTSQPVGQSLNRESTALFNNDNNGEQLTVNSQAYIGWRGKNRILRVGNLMLNTPLMNDDTTRIVPWSYQGASYVGRAIKDARVQLLHISQIRSHTSDTYKKESASGKIGRGITMLSFEYEGFDNLELQSFYYYAPDLYSTFIAQVDYKYILGKNHMFCASMQYFKSGNGGKYAQTENKNGGDDIDLIALRVGYDSDDLSININYSQNFGISGIVKGYGGLSKVLTTSMVANGRGNYKPETWMLKSVYDLPRTSWGESELAMNLTHTRTKDSRGDSFDALYAHVKQRFNLNDTIFLRYEAIDYKNDKSSVQYLRVIATHKF